MVVEVVEADRSQGPDRRINKGGYVSTEPIIFQNDNEVELWTAIVNGMGAFERRIVEADTAVRELRARMPAAQVQPTDPPSEESRVVRCEDGDWLIVRGPSGSTGEFWSDHYQMWLSNNDDYRGKYAEEDEANSLFASLTPAQLAAAVGVEVKG